MKNDVKELAILANDAYKETTKLNSLYKEETDVNRLEELYNKNIDEIYKKIEIYTHEESSFKANVYYKKDSKDIIISYKGSSELKDFEEDTKLFFGYGTAQLNHAKAVYKKIKQENKDANIILTGHSLGGMLATMVEIETTMEVYKDRFESSIITEENFAEIEKSLPSATVFETPGIFLIGDWKQEGKWEDYKNYIEDYGYELVEMPYENVMSVVYNPKEGSRKLSRMRIECYQNSDSIISQEFSATIGIQNNLKSRLCHGKTRRILVRQGFRGIFCIIMKYAVDL